MGCMSEPVPSANAETNIAPSSKVIENVKADHNVHTSSITIESLQTVSYDKLTLRVIAINDSRCPIGTQCVWAGQIVVALEVINHLKEKKQIELVRKREPKQVTVFGYDFLLQNVTPHPKDGKNIQLDEQSVTLQIIKLNIHE